jgi:hypothetical protein
MELLDRGCTCHCAAYLPLSTKAGALTERPRCCRLCAEIGGFTPPRPGQRPSLPRDVPRAWTEWRRTGVEGRVVLAPDPIGVAGTSSGGARKNDPLRKAEFVLHLSQSRNRDLCGLAARPWDERKDEENWSFEASCAQPGTRVQQAADFFIFSPRNPLKSHDSEKLMKGNESFFPFISLQFLSFPCADLAPWLN